MSTRVTPVARPVTERSYMHADARCDVAGNARASECSVSGRNPRHVRSPRFLRVLFSLPLLRPFLIPLYREEGLRGLQRGNAALQASGGRFERNPSGVTEGVTGGYGLRWPWAFLPTSHPCGPRTLPAREGSGVRRLRAVTRSTATPRPFFSVHRVATWLQPRLFGCHNRLALSICAIWGLCRVWEGVGQKPNNLWDHLPLARTGQPSFDDANRSGFRRYSA